MAGEKGNGRTGKKAPETAGGRRTETLPGTAPSADTRAERPGAAEDTGTPEAMGRRIALEAVLGAITARFAALPDERADAGMAQALEDLGRAVSVGRCVLYARLQGAWRLEAEYGWQDLGQTSPFPDISGLPQETRAWLGQILGSGICAGTGDAGAPGDADPALADFARQTGSRAFLLVPMLLEGEPEGFVLLDTADGTADWNPDVRGMLARAADTFARVLARKRAWTRSRRKETELDIRARQLEEVNIALRKLLEECKTAKRQSEERMAANVRQLVLPYVRHLKATKLGRDQQVFVGVIESNLEDISAPFMGKLTGLGPDLTPREIEIANFVRMGASSREIAGLLSISKRAVEFHRDRLRKKLGLKKRKRNLRSYLASIS
jgi:DNA-binding CsgD family transcriptional regulator